MMLLASFGVLGADTAEPAWVLKSGTVDVGKGPIYGTQGVAAPENRPGGRLWTSSFVDATGAMWLFGGLIADYHPLAKQERSELWKYEPVTGMWTWIRGGTLEDDPVSYGTQGVPDPANNPGPISNAMTWTDASGMIWMFSGMRDFQMHNELWRFDPSTHQWTWMKVDPRLVIPTANYGILGVADPANTPGPRRSGLTLTDASGNLWLFGGIGTGELNEGGGGLNDLWKFNPLSNNWTWISGSKLVNQTSTHGIKGVADASNSPGGRIDAAGWVDDSGNLWIFGGLSRPYSSRTYHNDLWKYEPATGLWTWMAGDVAGNPSGVYGTQGLAAAANTPGGRNMADAWVGPSGGLWLALGNGHDASGELGSLNDVWRYDIATGLWTWMKGDSIKDRTGTYGVQGLAAAANSPGGRYSDASWADPSGCLWVLNGTGFNAVENPFADWLHDLWKFDPVANMWTWVSGPKLAGIPGTYGALGVADPANIPGTRKGAAGWVHPTGSLRLFGGNGANDEGQNGLLNELWDYNPVTGQWTWLSGSKTADSLGIYGTQRVPASENQPGGRTNMSSWTDPAGVTWIFGGWGNDAEGSFGKLNDLWKYEPATNEWTWMSGARIINQTGAENADGISPGARYGASSWLDASGRLWLFGGSGYDDSFTDNPLNDLWRYDLDEGTWTRMGGPLDATDSGVHGIQGVPDSDNYPGARQHAATWTDETGCFWLFGGWGYDIGGNTTRLNDLWKYDPQTGYWTWMEGSSVGGAIGVYGTLGLPHATNTPGARFGATSWVDDAGRFWLMGGLGRDRLGDDGRLDDLWRFNPVSGNWTWMGGKGIRDQHISCLSPNRPDASNTPGGRYHHTSWADDSGRLWVFGGLGVDSTGIGDNMNDLWLLQYRNAAGNWTLFE